MTDDPGQDFGTEPEAAADEEEQSLLAQLRAQREKLGEERTTELEIPGYDPGIWVRFKTINWDRMKKVAQKVDKSKDPRKELHGHCDVIIAACVEILIYKPDSPRADVRGFVPLAREGEDPIRFDNRLAQLLDFDNDGRARQSVLKTFNNDLAVTAMHNELGEWMQGANEEVDAEFVEG